MTWVLGRLIRFRLIDLHIYVYIVFHFAVCLNFINSIFRLLTLQTKALLCINNILSTLPIENLGGIDGVYKVWIDAGKLVFKQNSKDMNILESATAVMRAALDKIKLSQNQNNVQCQLFQDMSLSDIEVS